MRKFLVLFTFLSVFAFSQTNNQKDLMQDVIVEKIKSKTLPSTLVNTFLGFGIGSFMQGDNHGGLVSLLGESMSLLVAAMGVSVGFALMDTKLSSNDIMQNFGHALAISNYATYSFAFSGAALLVFLGFRIYSIVRPSLYERELESIIKRAVGFNNGYTPVIDLRYSRESNFSLTLALKKTF